jgi:diguanylate cyclase (GGDEF)-like protein
MPAMAGSTRSNRPRHAWSALAGLGAMLLAVLRGRRPPTARNPLPRDRLTGLPTEAALRDGLEELLAPSRRQGWRVGVLVLDLRQFREVNEAHGRAAGDLALRLVATRLRCCIRREDLLARLAEDRFAVVQTALHEPASLLRMAERLSAAVAEPLPLDGAEPVVAPDIGLAIGPDDGDEAGILLAHAEEALAIARAAPAPRIHRFASGRQRVPGGEPGRPVPVEEARILIAAEAARSAA